MIRSMTAFARKERRSDWGAIAWELRSVNHRYLESGIRLPESLRALESAVRERIGQRLSRGKVDGILKFQSGGGALAALSLNRPLAGRLLELAAELEKLMGPGACLSVGDLLRWPGMVVEGELAAGGLETAVLDGLDEALAELVEAREREGARIAEMILGRCEAMADYVARIRARRPEVLSRLREKLLARLKELPLEADPNRLEQEMVFAAQRLDVEEELDRLDAHLAEIRAALGRPEPVGRRLDFLMQELNREANTLASKSNDAETTRAAVELKVLIEQMREQVQNVE